MSFDPLYRWSEVEPWLDRALELPRRRRLTFVRSQVEDAELLAQLERLLERTDTQGSEGVPQLAGIADCLEPAGEISPGSLLANYRVVRTLGVGGMASVVLAIREDDSLHQQVALKIQHAGRSDEASRRRFLAEGRFLVELDHPGIARVLDSGFFEGDPARAYLALEYIEGAEIDRYCREHRLGLRDVVKLFVEAARAVEFAHQHLVVHRDLKPSNLLVNSEGRCKLLDFGIAKVLAEADFAFEHDARPVTRTDQVLLTPLYAAPEQLRGEAVTTQTDVWGLGVLLYELLTRERPFSGSSGELERQICSGEPLAPSRRLGRCEGTPWLASDLNGDLDTIVGKALRKEPTDRYPSAGALADDLERYLSSRPIAARSQTLAYRVSRFVRRNRVAVTVAASLAVLVAVLTGFSVHQFFETVRQRDLAEAQRARAERERDRAEEVSGFLQGLFEASDPTVNLGSQSTVGVLLERGEDHLQDLEGQPLSQAGLALTLGNVRRELGDLDEATELHQLALERFETSLRQARIGPAPLNDEEMEEIGWRLSVAQVELADTLLRRADSHDAAELVLRRAEMGLEALEQEAAVIEQRFNVLNALALVSGQRGDEEEALRRFERAAAAMPSEPSETTTGFLINWGLALSVAGRFDQGEPVLRRALEHAEAAYSEDHPRVATAARSLASQLAKMDRAEEAAGLLGRATTITRQVFGSEHVETASLLNALGEVHRRSGNYDESIAAYREARGIYEQSYGSSHLAVSIVSASLCYSLAQARRLDEAVEQCNSGVSIATEALGRSNRYRGSALKFLGIALLAQGRIRDGDEALAEAGQVFIESLAESSVAHGEVALFRVLPALEGGRFDDAVLLAQRAQQVFSEGLGPDHRSTQMGEYWLQLANAAAEPALRDALLGRARALRGRLLSRLPDSDLFFELAERAEGVVFDSL